MAYAITLMVLCLAFAVCAVIAMPHVAIPVLFVTTLLAIMRVMANKDQ